MSQTVSLPKKGVNEFSNFPSATNEVRLFRLDAAESVAGLNDHVVDESYFPDVDGE